MLAHWYVARVVKLAMAPLILGLEAQRTFIETWNEVIRYD
jgi:hypothetical protein